MSLINREDLIAEYDRVHVGPPGGARKLIEDAPTVEPKPEWIPCSERMPEEKESCWAKYYGTDKWRNGMFCKCSEFVDVTVVRSDGKREVTLANTIDGKWVLMTSWIPPKTAEVIAWKPKAEPYMGDEK
jgi:hypothetical protein